MMVDLKIPIPGTSQFLEPDCIVQLGRFQTDRWRVQCGKFAYDGNRPMYGWYLTNLNNGEIKPLQEPDLIDIYVLEY